MSLFDRLLGKRSTQPVEILTQLRVLTQPVLDLQLLQLGGARFGASGRDIPRKTIKDVTFSPLVHSYRGGTNMEPEFYGADKKRLSLDEVIDSVIDADGMVHCPDGYGFKIASGKIVGFALYGADRGALRHFNYIQTYEECCKEFGRPDRCIEQEAYGDLMGYDLYYYGSQKHVNWDAVGNQISLINLGDYPGNRERADPGTG